MKLYSGPLSLFSRKVEIALSEKGVAFERVMVPFTQERGYQPKHPDVLAANPKGQVPVLVDGDFTLFDSTLIFEYLEEAYPTPPLMPKGAVARAQCRMMELRADEVVFPHARTFFYRTDPPHPDPARRAADEEAGARAEAALRDHFTALAEILGRRDFLCGDLSCADIAMFMTVLWTQRLKGPSIRDYPALAAWYDRLRARPPFGKAAAEIAAADRELTRPIGN
ncbi:glutathione S-transferase family protein [Dongia deserti]|uniref:glutathione S-transferase family protein n=1 Tax=Dongia deserti TaxID=2268030 RepID=UPI000E6516D4|nr:glutathione S-transferase family protein [Dongia deserti]